MKGFRGVRQAKFHFEQAQAALPAGADAMGEFPA
jgi:hypothetical protein